MDQGKAMNIDVNLALEIINRMDGMPIGDALAVLNLVQHTLLRQQHATLVKKYTNPDEQLLRVAIIEQKA